MNRRQFHTAAIGFFAGDALARGDEPMPDPEKPSTGGPNIKLPTFGGKQLWADQWFFEDWRIQRNAVTGHHRLLDGQDRRLAWGALDECKARFDEIRRARKLPPMQGEGVVVLHGLIRSRSAMKGIAAFLREKGKYTVFNVSYPSTRFEVAEHAKSLARVIESLDGITKISFVCHSLGNLVVRHWLGQKGVRPLFGEKRPDPFLGRMVMLGPPNHRPELASKAAWLDFTKQIGGKGLAQLAKHWDQLEPHLATPDFDFGILAGGKGDDRGYNPLVPGDDDLVVSVASTKLAGATDFRVLPVKHTFMMDDETVQAYTLRFLQKGWFESDLARQPL